MEDNSDIGGRCQAVPAGGQSDRQRGKLPPPTNRGVHFPKVGIHYLMITCGASVFQVQYLLNVIGIIRDYFEGDFCGWEEIGQNSRGLKVFSSCRGMIQIVEYGYLTGWDFSVGLRLRGEACERLGFEGVRALLCGLEREYPVGGRGLVRWQFSRADIAFDGVPFGVNEIYEASKVGDLSSQSVKADSVQFLENKDGKTVYLGKRSGQVFIRCYDSRGPVRYELEIKGDLARSIGVSLVSSDCSEWEKVFYSVAARVCRFCDRQNKRSDKAKDKSWWAEFLSGVVKYEPIKARVVKNPRYSVVKLRQLLERAAPAFAALRAEGRSFDSLLDFGVGSPDFEGWRSMVWGLDEREQDENIPF